MCSKNILLKLFENETELNGIGKYKTDCLATLENGLAVFYEGYTLIRLSKCTPRCLPKRNENLCSYKNSTQMFIVAVFIITPN